MPELAAYLSSLRDRLAVVVKRRDDLQRQLGEIAHEHDRLAAGISLLEEDLETHSPSLSDVPEDPPPLADQILTALPGSTGKTRADLQRVFRPRGVNENTLDSALDRLRKRGDLVKRGKFYFRSPREEEPLPSSTSSPEPVPPASVRSPDAADVAPVLGDVPSGKAVSAPAGTALVPARSSVPLSSPLPADERPLTARVYERVATMGGCSRADLARYFGVKGKAIDDVLTAFKKRGQLERRPDGMYVVVDGSAAPSPPPDASQAS